MLIPEECDKKTMQRGRNYLMDRSVDNLALNILPFRQGREGRLNKYYLTKEQGMRLLRRDIDSTFRFVEQLFRFYEESFYEADRAYRVNATKDVGFAEVPCEQAPAHDDMMVSYAMRNHWYYQWMERYRPKNSIYKESNIGSPYGEHVVQLRLMPEMMDFTRSTIKMQWKSVERKGSKVAMVMDTVDFPLLKTSNVPTMIEATEGTKSGIRYLLNKKYQESSAGVDQSEIYLSRWRYANTKSRIVTIGLNQNGIILMGIAEDPVFSKEKDLNKWVCKIGLAELYMDSSFENTRAFLATVVDFIIHEIEPSCVVFERTISASYTSILTSAVAKYYKEELDVCEHVDFDFFRTLLRCACFIHGISFVSNNTPGERMICMRCGKLSIGNSFGDDYFQCSNAKCPSSGKAIDRLFNLMNYLFIKVVSPAYGKIANSSGIVFREEDGPPNRYVFYPDRKVERVRLSDKWQIL